MSSKRDMRRPDLIVPYTPPEAKDSSDTDVSSTISSMLPMAAMYMRNRTIGWAAMSFAVQAWLSETKKSKEQGKQPAFFGILFSFIALFITYMPIASQMKVNQQGTGTGAPAPPPPAPA